MKKLEHFKFRIMKHWGNIYIFPNLYISITYNIPTIVFQWWIFRIDWIIWKRFPDWFMKYVWSTLNFDFEWLKKDDQYAV